MGRLDTSHHTSDQGAPRDLSQFPALVLNADFRPLSYLPLSLWSWQEAVKASFQDRVNIIAEYEEEVHSPSMTLTLPSVIALKDYVPMNRTPAFTRFNVFLRDHFRCQYCSIKLPAQDLTFDHVLPRAKGGKTSWDNVVTACQKCNLKKGSRLLQHSGLHLIKDARRPSYHQLQDYGRRFPPNFLHESWTDYLYWDVELED